MAPCLWIIVHHDHDWDCIGVAADTAVFGTWPAHCKKFAIRLCIYYRTSFSMEKYSQFCFALRVWQPQIRYLSSIFFKLGGILGKYSLYRNTFSNDIYSMFFTVYAKKTIKTKKICYRKCLDRFTISFACFRQKFSIIRHFQFPPL